MTSFISQSIVDLEKIARSKGFEKSETFIDQSLKPLTLNVQKAFEIISKFNMVPQKASANASGAPEQNFRSALGGGERRSSREGEAQRSGMEGLPRRAPGGAFVAVGEKQRNY